MSRPKCAANVNTCMCNKHVKLASPADALGVKGHLELTTQEHFSGQTRQFWVLDKSDEIFAQDGRNYCLFYIRDKL